jgi:hypothetical protein
MSLDTPRKSEQVPHSYNYGPAPETPVEDFDNTSLQDAVDGDLIKTPNHVGDLAKPERGKISKRNKVIALIAGLGIVAGGVGVGVAAANRPVPIEPGTSEPGEQPIDEGESVLPPEDGGEGEAPTTPEVSFDVTQIPESVVYGNLFETLSEEQKAEITRMAEMDLDTFRALPHAEQLTFAKFIRDNNMPILEYRLEQTGNTSYIEQANLETPEGIFASAQLDSFLLASLKTNSSENGIQFDALTAKKASALILDHTKDAERSQNLDEVISSWNVNTPPVLNPSTYNSSAIDEYGQTVINSTSFTGESIQITYVITEGTTIEGAAFKTSERLLAVGPADPRYRNSLAG